jgi:hypothetical protein
VPDLHPELLRDAFSVLDRYSTGIANRDPVKSLNEDRADLLRRVRAALGPLILNGTVPRDDVAEIAQRIDDALATGCSNPWSTNPRTR